MFDFPQNTTDNFSNDAEKYVTIKECACYIYLYWF